MTLPFQKQTFALARHIKRLLTLEVARLGGQGIDPRLSRHLAERPIALFLETTNTCNAACGFCPYRMMQRPHQVMPLPLFEKAVAEFQAMGGRALVLTPAVGDVLCDPLLLDRLDVIQRHPGISSTSFTTNLIAHRRFSDSEWVGILGSLRCLQVSMGGLEPRLYARMYGVDKLEVVREGVERLVRLKNHAARRCIIQLAFRTDSARYLQRARSSLKGSPLASLPLSNVFAYANWGGALRPENVPAHVCLDTRGAGRTPIPCSAMAYFLGVLSSGETTACSCCDFEGALFPLGNIREQSLSSMWKGPVRAELLRRMGRSGLEVCNRCTFYRPAARSDADLFALDSPDGRLPEGYFEYFGA